MRAEKYLAALMFVAMLVVLALFGAVFVRIAGGQHAVQQSHVPDRGESGAGHAVPEAQGRAGSAVSVRAVQPVAPVELRLSAPFGDGRERLLAARSCWVEAGFHRADCAAMLHVARIRASRVNKPWARVLYRYSAIHGSGARAVEARRFGWGDVPGKSPRFNADWAELRNYVAHVLAGLVDTPCAGATHWGSRTYPTDVRRARKALQRGEWRVVECTQPTSNIFFAELSR